MFSIAPMVAGSEDYLPAQDYYFSKRGRRRKRPAGDELFDDDSPDTDPDTPGFGDAQPYSIELPGEPPGWWAGGLATYLGLAGEIHEEPYRRIFRGLHPFTGKPLVANAGSPNRRPGWEGCISAVKDYSVLTFAVPAEWRTEFLQAFREVAEDVLKMIEEQFAFSRKGSKYIRVRLLAALWEHASSRALDEDLHIHIQIFNLGVDEHGNIRAIDPLLQGQRVLTLCSGKDLEHVFLVPTTSAAFHGHAVFVRVLLQQRQREAIQPSEVLSKMFITDA